jgi:DNA-binding XRE family transcriptional regulator
METAFPKLYTKKDLAGIIRCSRTTIDRHIERGDLRYDYKRGSTILFEEKTVIEYINSLKVKI